jgi:hypothetical protein
MHLIPPGPTARPAGARRGARLPAGDELSTKSAARARKKADDLPRGSYHSEEHSLAILRRAKNRDDELVVRFAGQSCVIELTASGRAAAIGDWLLEVSRHGRPLKPVSDWESICWHSDAEVDYLELQIELDEEVIMQRHLIFAREDRFLLLADAVLSTRLGGLEYRGTLPLAEGAAFRAAVETREGLLVGGARSTGFSRKAVPPKGGTTSAIAKVLPIALPEWREEVPGGELEATDRGLELCQSTERQRLFAPLLLDLDRARFRRRLTWRTLTVAESLATVPADGAVGYRVAIGKQQWIIYRSLGAKGNRTLLGHNLSTETLVARFATNGEVTSIIEIE